MGRIPSHNLRLVYTKDVIALFGGNLPGPVHRFDCGISESTFIVELLKLVKLLNRHPQRLPLPLR